MGTILQRLRTYFLLQLVPTTWDIPGSILQQGGILEITASIIAGLAASLKLIFYCLLSIKGFVLYCKVQISIDFANKVAKIWPKSNSLVTYEFLGQNTGLHVCNAKSQIDL